MGDFGVPERPKDVLVDGTRLDGRGFEEFRPVCKRTPKPDTSQEILCVSIQNVVIISVPVRQHRWCDGDLRSQDSPAAVVVNKHRTCNRYEVVQPWSTLPVVFVCHVPLPSCSHADWHHYQSSRLSLCRGWQHKGHSSCVSAPTETQCQNSVEVLLFSARCIDGDGQGHI